VIAKRRLPVVVAIALAIGLAAPAARADGDPAPAPSSPEQLFQQGATALKKGEYGAAIDAFESLADQGYAHPDASYDRGLAYVMRVRAHADRPGDLGRAAAAFEETLLLRPGDRDADLALDRVRAEVTRRRAQKKAASVEVRPTLDRLVVGLASEITWGALGIAASVLLAIGLVLRRRPRGPAHVAGSVLAPVAAVALIALVPLSIGARHLRRSTRAAVVVVSEIRMEDDDGHASPGDAIPEAASVEAGERRGGLVHVRWGASEGWVPAGSVRLIGP
jgi:hypothetical protein